MISGANIRDRSLIIRFGIAVCLLGFLVEAGCSNPRRTDMNEKDIKKMMADEAKEIKIGVRSVMFELVRIPPGEFMMGSSSSDPDARPNEQPAKRVRITQSFYIGKYEVTQKQYKMVIGNNPSSHKGDNLPVYELTIVEALEFCRKLSEMTGLEVTLPTEAQWEYSCRSGSDTRFNLGNTREDLERSGWYRDNSDEQPHPVGQKEPNSWGLYDMHGNVTEICRDLISSFEMLTPVDPIGVIDNVRSAMRGGGFMHDMAFCRSAARLVSTPRFGGAGFRILVNP